MVVFTIMYHVPSVQIMRVFHFDDVFLVVFPIMFLLFNSYVLVRLTYVFLVVFPIMFRVFNSCIFIRLTMCSWWCSFNSCIIARLTMCSCWGSQSWSLFPNHVCLSGWRRVPGGVPSHVPCAQLMVFVLLMMCSWWCSQSCP
jgi:hypothetical protein